MNVDEREREKKQRDLEVEIVDLPEEKDDTPRKRVTRPFSRFSTSIQADTVTRQRRIQLAVTASIVAIVAILILASSLPVRTLAVRLFSGPRSLPTAAIAPGSDLFYINGAPAWGRAYLDGHVITHLPKISIDAPLRIGRGQHVMLWQAAPFQEQRCIVSVPPDYSNDTCHYNDSVHLPSGRGSAWLLSFPASLLIVPNQPRQALLQAVQKTLDDRGSTEIVRAGELYNSPSQQGIYTTAGPPLRGMFIQAGQPLRATLHFQLDTSPLSPTSAPCIIDGQNNGLGCTVWGEDCFSFCTDPTASNDVHSFANEWDVLGVVLPVWDYTTLDGKSVAQNQPDAFAGAEGYETLLPLHIFWSGSAWQVTLPLDRANTLPFGNPFCMSAETEVQIDSTLNGAQLKNFLVSWKFISGTNPAAGCVAVATPNLSGLLITPPPSYHVAAICLQRFGELLAANDVAHRLWPTMPVADAYEQQLAQKLAG